MSTPMYAPATFAVRDFPNRTLHEALRSLERWSEQLRFIDNLLASDGLLAVDVQRLKLERKTIACAALACTNVIAACEKEMRKQRQALEEKWGWLL